MIIVHYINYYEIIVIVNCNSVNRLDFKISPGLLWQSFLNILDGLLIGEKTGQEQTVREN